MNHYSYYVLQTAIIKHNKKMTMRKIEIIKIQAHQRTKACSEWNEGEAGYTTVAKNNKMKFFFFQKK